jgi:hypothetical protein
MEELFDAPEALIESMKDVLTRGEYCVNYICYKMQTGHITAPTNHSPKEWGAKSASHEAFVKRFPVQVEVKWDDYTAIRYDQLLRVRDGVEVKEFTKALELSHKEGFTFSPRDARRALPYYQKRGLEAFKFLFGTPEDVVSKIIRLSEEEVIRARMEERIARYEPVLVKYKALQKTSKSALPQTLWDYHVQIELAVADLRGGKIADGVLGLTTKYMTLTTNLMELSKIFKDAAEAQAKKKGVKINKTTEAAPWVL